MKSKMKRRKKGSKSERYDVYGPYFTLKKKINNFSETDAHKHRTELGH